ncbi:benzoylformate decarboxylase [Saccharospirillum sp.]|uniref:benzoylformate decarboxylase n=1 Tax=Saccharospirillum sp. TaxID=2033801 RepID=UPI0034A07AC4
MTKTVKDISYQVLRHQGMTTVFGNPGSNELPFLKGFPEDFRYILGLHEGAVVGMADGFAQASGLPTLVNLHAAAGTGNAMGALTNAVYSHSPLVITAGQQSRHLVGMEGMLANVDANLLPRPLVKWSGEPTCATDVPRMLSQAINTANQPAKGPVYLSIPLDDWAQASSTNSEYLLSRTVQTASSPSESQLKWLADALSEATSPALVLGPGVDAVKANASAVALAERLGAVGWIAPSESRCPFPTDHPAFRGTLPISEKGLNEALAGHDLVLVVGAPVFRYHQNIPGDFLAPGTRLIHLTDDPAEASRAPLGEALVGDIAAMLAALPERIVGEQRAQPVARSLPPPGKDEADRMHPDTVFRIVNELAPSDAIYVKEATATKGPFWANIIMREPGSFYFPAAGGLGFGMPAAVGVQLAQPQRQVIALIGDGSANYNITALWTAARYRIPVVFIILKNGTYGALRRFAKLMDAEDVPGLDVPGIDFCSIARGYGVDACAATNADTLSACLTHAFSQDKPYLIEVSTSF